MTHQKYFVTFLFFAFVAIVWAFWISCSFVQVFLFWMSISCFWMATSFLLHQPEMVMGKKKKTILSCLFIFINFPFLITYWSVWLLRNLCFEKDGVNHIPGTNISISCWPSWRVDTENYDLVIDLTSEMPKLYRIKGLYVCLPNIDGVPLDRFKLPVKINREMRILVHCAQGRGRSAIMTCMVLVQLKYAASGTEALQILKQVRPRVSVSVAQRTQIERFLHF